MYWASVDFASSVPFPHLGGNYTFHVVQAVLVLGLWPSSASLWPWPWLVLQGALDLGRTNDSLPLELTKSVKL